MRYVCVILALFTLVGCETTQKIVKDRPWLAGLPGAVGGDLTAAAPKDKAAPGPALLADDEIVVVKDDGSKKLIAQTGRHLLIHIYCCLRDKDRDLFAQQVLSELTKADFRAKGKDPREALDMLIAQPSR